MLALVTVGVFGLFHPAELEVRPAHGGAIVIERGGVREKLEGAHFLRIRTAARVGGRDGGPAEFVLSVPGRIQREFHGRLEVRPSHGELLAIVEMDRETAVASIVAAELPGGTPVEALKAQAVAARSFLVASRHRHDGFDFCDTTHCQFLRAPPQPGSPSPAARAAVGTGGLALAYQGHVFAALYSADCGGHTRALADAEWESPEPRPDDYPYFAVACPRLKGATSGHGVGLCQAGAAEMAQTGATFREILAHFYPATTLLKTSSVRRSARSSPSCGRSAPAAALRARERPSRATEGRPAPPAGNPVRPVGEFDARDESGHALDRHAIGNAARHPGPPDLADWAPDSHRRAWTPPGIRGPADP